MNILQRFIIWFWYDRDNKTYSEAKNYLVLKNTLEKAESKKNPDKEYIKHLKLLIKLLENSKGEKTLSIEAKPLKDSSKKVE